MAKAIIVDDSKFMRNIIRDTLEEGGHEIIAVADNGEDGIESFRAFKPDFVTMDITMGGKDGILAVEGIKEIDPDAVIIVISALNENTIKGSAKELKASAFVTKPFNKEKLLETVSSLLK